MKILFSIILLFAVSYSRLHAQNLSDKIDIEAGYKYHDIYLDRSEIKKLLKKDRQAYEVFKPSRFTHTVSYFLVSAGLGTMIAPLQVKLDNNNDTNVKNATPYIGIGLGLLAVAIPFKIKSNRQTKAAVELYNSRLSSNLNQRSKPEFRFGFTGNGPGMAVTF